MEPGDVLELERAELEQFWEHLGEWGLEYDVGSSSVLGVDAYKSQALEVDEEREEGVRSR